MTREEKQEKARVSRIMSEGPIDLPFALLVLLLTTIGVLMVFSASFARSYYEAENPTTMVALSVFLRQAFFAVAGVVAMFVVSKIDYHWWRRWASTAAGAGDCAAGAGYYPTQPAGCHQRRCNPLAERGDHDLPAIGGGEVCGNPLFCRYHHVSKSEKMNTFRTESCPIVLILGVISRPRCCWSPICPARC